jgi:soluble lytic murein transglycosylase
VPIGKKWFMILPARLPQHESTRRKALYSASPPTGLSDEARRFAARANFLLRHQLPEADWDLDKLTLAASPAAPPALAQLFLYVEAFDRCVRTAEQAGSNPDGRAQFANILPYLYPLAHTRKVEELVADTDIDPLIIHAVMREESRLNGKLTSTAGAVGLMQIMPGTGRWIASIMDLEDYDEESLRDRDVNMTLGVWYLDYLWDEFDGNLVHVLAAYNAGPGNVRRWLEARTGSEDVDVFIETIPFDETRNYVKKVLGAYGNYIQLYK